jgi:hypothetical protein
MTQMLCIHCCRDTRTLLDKPVLQGVCTAGCAIVRKQKSVERTLLPKRWSSTIKGLSFGGVIGSMSAMIEKKKKTLYTSFQAIEYC